MFDVAMRDEVEGYLIRLAEADERITAAAVVGSRACTEGDQWSDIDLTFAVADATAPVAVLDEWAQKLRAQFDGTTLFDLAAGPITYRVFLLPDRLAGRPLCDADEPVRGAGRHLPTAVRDSERACRRGSA